MLTADQLVDQALSRVGEVTSDYPSARGPMYRRVGDRQRRLFAMAVQLNPEFYGTSSVAAVQASVVNLASIQPPIDAVELVQYVTVEDAGVTYTRGTEISLVTADDVGAELPPRAVLRDGLLIGVSTDFANVLKVRLWYPRLPVAFSFTDGAKQIELDQPWDTLLELDLVLWLLAKATRLADSIRVAAIESFKAEESLVLAEFREHVGRYAVVTSRFTRTRINTEVARDVER